ncbi:MAG: DUF4241 domain-containing protein [Hyphomicrobium sp.]|uniref:DUF4241 domain-containing protein n=1 Tax=Hyphomicrobium sp. TaxID=82 RepID=UPI003D09A379
MLLLRIVLAVLGLLAAARAASAAGDAPPYAALFDRAFAPGFVVETRDEVDGEMRVETVPFRAVDAGMLKLPSGRITVADPFVALTEAKPLAQAVPAGSFPVRLAVGAFPAGGLRVAFARVDVTQAPVVRWSMALIEGQDVRTLGHDEIFGYPVDSGTGSFFDPAAGRAAGALLDSNPNAWEAWIKAGEANGAKIGPYFFLLDLPLGAANALMFRSGWGDGFYASWFGYDALGNVAALVTDFAIIDWGSAKW